MKHNSLLICGIIGLIIIAVSNANRFVNADKQFKSKDRILYLPSPEISKLTALGHNNTVAKLRFIDSIAYTQYQFDVRNDSIETTRSGTQSTFEKLYDSLIALDPHYKKFYTYAALNTSGLVENHHAALIYLLRATTNFPNNHFMWMNLLVTLTTYFDYETKRPEQMTQLLMRWSDSVSEIGQKAVPDNWISGIERRQRLDQTLYWLSRVNSSPRLSTEKRIALHQAKLSAARYNQNLLTSQLIKKNRLPSSLTISDLNASAKTNLPIYSALRLSEKSKKPELSPDPWGYYYVIDSNNQVKSPGLHYYLKGNLLNSFWNKASEYKRDHIKTHPDISHLITHYSELKSLPPEASVTLENQRPRLNWPQEDTSPPVVFKNE